MKFFISDEISQLLKFYHFDEITRYRRNFSTHKKSHKHTESLDDPQIPSWQRGYDPKNTQVKAKTESYYSVK